jgi:ribosomal protein S18 acetylase RimI-like enzyme
MKLESPLRWATPEDAADMAFLMNEAGHGMPYWFWKQSAKEGQDPFEVGQVRARRESGSFSYKNAIIVELEGKVVGMLLCYVAEEMPDAEIQKLPERIQTAARLENRIAEAFNINALAMRPETRGQGWGKRLLDLVHTWAHDRGCSRIGLLVEKGNEGAFRLYQREGFSVIAEEPMAALDDLPPSVALLMVSAVRQVGSTVR